MFDAKEGYNMLTSRPDEAKAKLASAIEAWESALEEGDMDDKKFLMKYRPALLTTNCMHLQMKLVRTLVQTQTLSLKIFNQKL